MSAPGAARGVEAAALRRLELFADLSDERLEWLAANGQRRRVEAGEVIYAQADQINRFIVLMEGEIESLVEVDSQATVVHHHRPVTFIGAIALLTGDAPRGSGRASQPSEIVTFEPEIFQELVRLEPEVGRQLIGVIGPVTRRVERISREREKLASLGAIAAGLAHEINNPASAVVRAGADLRAAVLQLGAAPARLAALGVDVAALERLGELSAEGVAATAAAEPIDVLERSDREDELAPWLEERGVADAEALAADVVGAGLDIDWAERVAAAVSSDALPEALAWLSSGLAAAALLDQVEHAAARITTLVGAVREYSYMDEAPEQDVDVHRGLESTLTMFAHRLREGNVRVVREYDRDLPPISAFGSELNQVWTNLIDNALDAMEGSGTLTVRTGRLGDRVSVEIADTGPGVPDDLQTRVFEPFFTTKEVGEGSGQGLDVAYRVVVERHHGDLRLESVPGDTRFTVTLPPA